MSDAKPTAPERPVDPTYEGQKNPGLVPKDAATLILVRKPKSGAAEVLLGCRSGGHAFMPNRYVFPGGRLDLADASIPHATPLQGHVHEKLALATSQRRARALAITAIRETWEEAGLKLASTYSGKMPANADKSWTGFLDAGEAPALDALEYVARAITPPGRPRRFNARFFMADAERATGTIKSNGELGDIRWVNLEEARKLPLPTITGLILGEVGRLMVEGFGRPEERKIPLFKTVRGKHLLLSE